MAIDYIAKRDVATRQIHRWGQASELKRGDTRRPCWAVEVQLTSTERSTLKNTTNRVFLISADPADLTEPPDDKQDALVWTEDGVEKTLRQDAPVSPLRPGGITLYYEIQVRG